MNLIKLDRRYDGFDRFTHRVEFRYGTLAKQQQWVKCRNWLWQQFGPSAELNLARPEYFEGKQPQWAWDAEKSSLYLSNDALTMFILKRESWENEQKIQFQV